MLIEEYQKILAQLDQKCDEVYKQLPFIPCEIRCCDCCKQFFPISFIEAYYLSQGVNNLPRQERRLLQKSALKIKNKLDKTTFSEDRVFFGTRDEVYDKLQEFFQYIKSMDFICPYLNEERLCDVYQHRPHDCRVHGCSYDIEKNDVLGCSRFNEIPELKDPLIKEKLVDFYYLYPEMRSLDAALIRSFSNHPKKVRMWYFTTLLQPILTNYHEKNWQEFFNIDMKSVREGDYVLILDF